LDQEEFAVCSCHSGTAVGQETEAADRQEIEDVASRETEVEVLVPWDCPLGVPDGQEDP
jgi:hypothetical protein